MYVTQLYFFYISNNKIIKKKVDKIRKDIEK